MPLKKVDGVAVFFFNLAKRIYATKLMPATHPNHRLAHQDSVSVSSELTDRVKNSSSKDHHHHSTKNNYSMLGPFQDEDEGAEDGGGGDGAFGGMDFGHEAPTLEAFHNRQDARPKLVSGSIQCDTAAGDGGGGGTAATNSNNNNSKKSKKDKKKKKKKKSSSPSSNKSNRKDDNDVIVVVEEEGGGEESNGAPEPVNNSSNGKKKKKKSGSSSSARRRASNGDSSSKMKPEEKRLHNSSSSILFDGSLASSSVATPSQHRRHHHNNNNNVRSSGLASQMSDLHDSWSEFESNNNNNNINNNNKVDVFVEEQDQQQRHPSHTTTSPENAAAAEFWDLEPPSPQKNFRQRQQEQQQQALPLDQQQQQQQQQQQPSMQPTKEKPSTPLFARRKKRPQMQETDPRLGMSMPSSLDAQPTQELLDAAWDPQMSLPNMAATAVTTATAENDQDLAWTVQVFPSTSSSTDHNGPANQPEQQQPTQQDSQEIGGAGGPWPSDSGSLISAVFTPKVVEDPPQDSSSWFQQTESSYQRQQQQQQQQQQQDCMHMMQQDSSRVVVGGNAYPGNDAGNEHGPDALSFSQRSQQTDLTWQSNRTLVAGVPVGIRRPPPREQLEGQQTIEEDAGTIYTEGPPLSMVGVELEDPRKAKRSAVSKLQKLAQANGETLQSYLQRYGQDEELAAATAAAFEVFMKEKLEKEQNEPYHDAQLEAYQQEPNEDGNWSSGDEVTEYDEAQDDFTLKDQSIVLESWDDDNDISTLGGDFRARAAANNNNNSNNNKQNSAYAKQQRYQQQGSSVRSRGPGRGGHPPPQPHPHPYDAYFGPPTAPPPPPPPPPTVHTAPEEGTPRSTGGKPRLEMRDGYPMPPMPPYAESPGHPYHQGYRGSSPPSLSGHRRYDDEEYRQNYASPRYPPPPPHYAYEQQPPPPPLPPPHDNPHYSAGMSPHAAAHQRHLLPSPANSNGMGYPSSMTAISPAPSNATSVGRGVTEGHGDMVPQMPYRGPPSVGPEGSGPFALQSGGQPVPPTRKISGSETSAVSKEATPPVAGIVVPPPGAATVISTLDARTLQQQIDALTIDERRTVNALRIKWEARPNRPPFPSEWYLRFAQCSPGVPFTMSTAWKVMKKFERRYLTLSITGMERQLQTQTLFPSRGLKSVDGHDSK